MYIIKQLPEDFIVKEISNVKIEDNGPYSYFILKKKDYNTVKAIEKIADKLNIPSKFIGFAGNKDRKAVTEQLISIKNLKNISKDKIETLKLDDIGLKYIGKGENPISLGDLKGNKFVIAIKNLTREEINQLKKMNKGSILIPNYFGEQRFGKNNAEIGKAIIKGNFKKAAELAGLETKNNDYIGGLRKINKKILRLYIHSYQSFLFNETANRYLKKNKKHIKIPVIGFGTEIEKIEDNDLKDILKQIIKKEKISLRDFIIRQIPELSSEGAERELFIEIKDFKIREIEKDKAVVSFSLPKGCYATVVIRELLSPQ